MRVSHCRRDRCPGASRPWPADDGLLVRLRLIGGRVPAAALRRLAEVTEEFGDGRIYLTSRANLQVRAFPGEEGELAPEALAALETTGLLPTRSHELIRNVMVSPRTGLAGGVADLRGTAAELDALLCADPLLATLSARFLVVLDDGCGDLIGRSCDLGLVALPGGRAQLRAGTGWGPVIPVSAVAGRIADLAHRFARSRGTSPSAPWHVAELPEPLLPPAVPDPRLPAPATALPYGRVPGGWHAEAAAGLGREETDALTEGVPEVVVTPWRGVFIPEENR